MMPELNDINLNQSGHTSFATDQAQVLHGHNNQITETTTIHNTMDEGVKDITTIFANTANQTVASGLQLADKSVTTLAGFFDDLVGMVKSSNTEAVKANEDTVEIMQTVYNDSAAQIKTAYATALEAKASTEDELSRKDLLNYGIATLVTLGGFWYVATRT